MDRGVLAAAADVLRNGDPPRSAAEILSVLRATQPDIVPPGMSLRDFRALLREHRHPQPGGAFAIHPFSARDAVKGTPLDQAGLQAAVANIQLVGVGLRQAYLVETNSQMFDSLRSKDIHALFVAALGRRGFDTQPETVVAGGHVQRFFLFHKSRPIPPPADGAKYSDPEVATILGFLQKGIPPVEANRAAVHLLLAGGPQSLMTEIVDTDAHPDFLEFYRERRKAFNAALAPLGLSLEIEVDVLRPPGWCAAKLLRQGFAGEADLEHCKTELDLFYMDDDVWAGAVREPSRVRRVLVAALWQDHDPMSDMYPLATACAKVLDGVFEAFINAPGADVAGDLRVMCQGVVGVAGSFPAEAWGRMSTAALRAALGGVDPELLGALDVLDTRK